MKISRFAVAFSFTAALTFGLVGASARVLAGQDHETLNIHNETGHKVAVFLFKGEAVHTNEKGADLQWGFLANHETKTADVPFCTFEVLLVDANDIWHAEVHDCHSTDMTFKADTGHGTRK